MSKNKTLEKQQRCPKGFIRDKKTGNCIPKMKDNKTEKTKITKKGSPKTRKNKTTLVKLLEERQKCINKWRNKK